MAQNWKSLVDQMLEDARQSGQFDHLPGGGRPLKLEDDPYTPDDMKLAHKILKDHDLAPAWVMLGKDVEALRERLLEDMRKGLIAYQGALGDAERSSAPVENRQRAEAIWIRAREVYQSAADRLNRDILRYNLKVPPGIPQKRLFEVARELDRLLG